ncbi:ankyrin repeat-containing protein At5g02620-like [Fagus crenata]
MDPVYYNAAKHGKIDVFRKIKDPLERLLTPTRNTVLHVYLTSLIEGRASSTTDPFVKEILTLCSSLLWQINTKRETPLHIAARHKHSSVVKVLIELAKAPYQDVENAKKVTTEMLVMLNKENDTTLREAVRFNHLEVVKLLIQADAYCSYSDNEFGETPLYMAVERKSQDLVFEILDNCFSPAHGGPHGRTTLHAAVFCNNKEMTDKILRATGNSLIKKTDENGWTPLHWCAFLGSSSTTMLLLNVGREIAYLKDPKGRTALHIAADQGNDVIIKDILQSCPNCCELVDKRGWNILHYAVSSSQYSAMKVVSRILGKSSFSNRLNEKDADGKTPIHLDSKTSSLFVSNLMHHHRVDKMAFNKQNLGAYDIAVTIDKIQNRKYKDIERIFVDDRVPEEYKNVEEQIISEVKDDNDDPMLQKVSEAHLVVDALIATVTFAAGITMPGGFIQEGRHAGSAILTGNGCFKAFVIMNSIAMVLSSSAAFIHLFTPLMLVDSTKGRNFSIGLTYVLTLLALVAMVIAFVMGKLAVLGHSLDLAILTCTIGLCFFVIVFFIIKNWVKLSEIWSTIIFTIRLKLWLWIRKLDL